jgi:hypothetical protein
MMSANMNTIISENISYKENINTPDIVEVNTSSGKV